ncbi:MAG TPA: hypothetical protein VHW00_12700 [Thermoanaerobaculia bacterium]|nr:hypothetical protein [Thermoanaerobaculia bacterium]
MSACRFEAQILEAVERDAWTTALREHLSGCDDCIAAATVSPWMSRFANLGDREHRLPDASIVYLKAKLLQGRVDVLRASRPMDIVQMIAYLVVAGGWAALLTWKWQAIEAWLRSLTPTAIVLKQSSGAAESLSMSFLAFVIVLASMTVMLALHTIMAEE